MPTEDLQAKEISVLAVKAEIVLETVTQIINTVTNLCDQREK